VAYLDTDVGQPEFTPPGFVSLHVLEEQTKGVCSGYPIFNSPLKCSTPWLNILSYYYNCRSYNAIPAASKEVNVRLWTFFCFHITLYLSIVLLFGAARNSPLLNSTSFLDACYKVFHVLEEFLNILL
jgi:hypothetical protein